MNKQIKQRKYPKIPNDEVLKELHRFEKLWQKYRQKACTLDIETTHVNGEIAIVGISFRIQNGQPEYVELISGKNLSRSPLKHALSGCKLLITFNGTKHDLIYLKRKFKDFLPKQTIHLDLSELAALRGHKIGLKELEELFRHQETLRVEGVTCCPLAGI